MIAAPQKPSWEEFERNITALYNNISKPIFELVDGIREGTIPWHICLPLSILGQALIGLGFDHRIFSLAGKGWLYPNNPVLFCLYYWAIVSLPFVLWSLYRTALKQFHMNELSRVFQEIGLKNQLGRLPSFVADRSLDAFTRKLRLMRSSIPLRDYQQKKPYLEGALQIFIDEIKEDRSKGTVDLIYSPFPMPKEFRPESFDKLKKNQFLVGTTRSKQFIDDLERSPHLLVAGQTGGGKSTFLRQLITSFYLGNRQMTFTLIDLKGGLEFQLFEDLPRIKVIGNLESAALALNHHAAELERRMTVIKANKCKDISQLLAMPPDKRVSSPGVGLGRMHRHMIVVDEAAELFLVGGNSGAKEIQAARKTLSQIARQGRALGIHLVIATQRPDSRALDPQVKANLTGVLCFQMANDISSITVLGNGRATDLPPVPGRAIWKSTAEMIEVQTPYMPTEIAESLLNQFRPKEDSKSQAEQEIESKNERSTIASDTEI